MTIHEIFKMFGTPFDANNATANDPFFVRLKREAEEDLEDYYDLENDVNSSEWFEDR